MYITQQGPYVKQWGDGKAPIGWQDRYHAEGALLSRRDPFALQADFNTDEVCGVHVRGVRSVPGARRACSRGRKT